MFDEGGDMRAFHNDLEIKKFYLERVQKHRAAHHLVQGVGWEKCSDGELRGCGIGCTLEAYEHSRYPVELGIPMELACLEDALFEGLPHAAAMLWPERFLEAIPVGKNLSRVWPHFAVWLLTEELRGHVTSESRAVVVLYQRRLKGDEPTYTEWEEAEAAAAVEVSRVLGARAQGEPNRVAASWAASAARAAAAAQSGGAARAASYAAAAASHLRRPADLVREASFVRQADKLTALLKEDK